MNAWLLTGWTMLHFLWIGTLLAAAGAVVRLACRRASPNLRYAASLATLVAVACTPFVIACLLASNPTPVPAAWEPPAPPVDGPMTSRTASDRVADVGDAVEVDHEGVPRRSRGLSGNGETFFELNTQGDGGVSRSELPGDLATTNSQAGDTSVGESRGAAVAAAAEQTAGAETPGLRQGLTAELIQRIVGMLPFVWIAGAPITFLLLAAGLVGSRRLTRAGTPLGQGPAAEACTQLRTALGVTRRVAVAAVEGLAQPVLVGIIKPTILLPAAALNGWTVAELEMVLVHELAHVRRWDNAVNLAQRLVESLLFFHPCVWLASRQVRRDREECCDALVVAHTQQPEAYAELLINVASTLRSEPGRPRPGLRGETPRLASAVMALAGSSPMAQHALVGRVRRILKLEDEPMWISRRMMALVTVSLLAVTATAYRSAVAEEDKAIEAKVATEEEPKYPMTYETENIENADLVELLRLAAASEIDIMWHDDKKAIVIEANRVVHAVIAELLRKGSEAATHSSQGGTGEAVAEEGRAEPQTADENLNRAYPIGDIEAIHPAAWLRATGHAGVEITWHEDNHSMIVSAPPSVHDGIADVLRQGREASRPPGVIEVEERLDWREAPEEKKRRQQLEIELPKLRREISMYQSQLMEVDRDLMDAEVAKEVAIQRAQSPDALEAAVAAELDKDLTIAGYKRDLFALGQQIQELDRNVLGDVEKEQLKRLQELSQRTEQLLQQYRIGAEKDARQRLATIPNEALRASIMRYRELREPLVQKRVSLEKQLAELEAQLAAQAAGDASGHARDGGQDLHPAPQLPAALAADDVDLTDSSGLTRTPEVMHAYTLGLRAAEGGDSIEALAHFAEALRHDPAFTDAYLAKGNVLRQMQDYVDAVRAYSQALEIDASLAAAYHGRGECYMAMSPPDYNLAIGDFERAVDLDPRNAKARETRNQLRAMAAAEADDTPSREPVEVELRLNANGATSLDGEELTIDEAAERFALLSSDARVRLVAEPTRPYHDIVTWMDALKAAGVSQVDLTLAPGTVGDPSSTPGEAGPRDTPSSATSPLTVKVLQRPLVNGSRVTAYLEVTAHDGSSSLERQREMALVPALLKSDPVLSAAFNRVAPNYKRLREISEEGAAELREQFKVSFVNESPIVELTMPADEEGANLALMSAVIEEVRREISTRAFGAAGDAVATDGNPSPGPSPPGRGAGAPYRIGPGDTLRVRSIGNLPDQVDGTFIVEEEGTIAIGPAYGRVEVTGLTVREAETAVLKTLTAAATAHFGHSEFQPKVQVTLEGKAREARGASGEAREGEIAAAPGGAYLVPSTPGTSTTESPIIPIPDHPSPAGVEVSRLVAIADQFPDGVDESEAKRIVAELKRQGFDAELRMEGDKPMLLVRTQSPHTRFLWEQSTSDGRVVWHCRVVNFDAAGIPPYATGRAAYSDPRGGGGVVYPVSPPGEPAVGSPVAPVVAPPRSDGVPQSVEMLPGMTEDDLKRIADELSGLGFRVTALRRNDGRLMLEFLGLEVKARPVWETRQIGDASGRTRMARTLRLVGPDGRTIAPSNADRGSVPPTTHVLVLEAAKGVERAVAKEFVEKLKEQNLDAELLEWDERLAIGIRNMATGFKPLWETRTKDGQARAFVRFVDDESGLMTMPIDAGLWKPAVRTPETGAGGMIVPTPGMPSSGAPLLAAPGTSYGPSPALTFGRGETQAVIATPPGTSDADATLIHHELQQQGYRVDLERLGDKSQLRFSLLPAVPKAVWEERLIDGRRVAFLRLLGPDDRDLAPHSNRQLWIPAPLIDGGGVNPSPGPSLQGRGMLEEAEGSDPEVRRAGPTPLYDGKTFETWRAHWRSELKVAKRMEAVEALAAFARAGHGREAAEALLDVAGEYEFGGGGGGAELLGQIIETLSGRDSDSIAMDVWLPVLVERIRLSQGEKQRHWRGLLDAVLRQWSIKHEQPSEQLLALATDETVGVQVAALCALVRETPAFAQGADPRVIALVRRALQGAEPAVELLSDLEFVNLREFPEQLDLLLHEDAKIQTRARQILRQVGRVESPEIVDSLLQVALNDGPAAKRVAAVRALGSMGARLHQRRPSKLIGQLKNLAVTTDEEQLLAPTLFALSLIEGFGDGAAGAGGVVAELKEQHADAITHERLAALQAAVSQMPEEKRQFEGK